MYIINPFREIKRYLGCEGYLTVGSFYYLFYSYDLFLFSAIYSLSGVSFYVFISTFYFVFILIKNVSREKFVQGNNASCSECHLALLELSLHVARVASLQDDNACSTCFAAATLHATSSSSSPSPKWSTTLQSIKASDTICILNKQR